MIWDKFKSIEGLEKLRDLYKQIEMETESFMAEMSLQCPPLCGECCDTPSFNIEATVFEMLLPAIELWEKGEAPAVLDRLAKLPPESRCLLFIPFQEPGSGKCGMYQNRALICRLFGVSGNRDKYRRIRFSPCFRLKRETPAIEIQTQTLIEQGVNVPLFSNYRQQILGLNPLLAEKLYPINTALDLALQKTGF